MTRNEHDAHRALCESADRGREDYDDDTAQGVVLATAIGGWIYLAAAILIGWIVL